MPATLEEVKQLIESGFPNADVSDIHEEENRVTGIIRWAGFKGMDFDDRYNLVVREVREKLGYRSLNLGFLLPLAPGDKPNDVI